MFVRIGLVVLVACLLGCDTESTVGSKDGGELESENRTNSQEATRSTPKLKKLFGSAQAIDTIQNAETVNSYLLSPPSRYQKSFSDYKIAGDPVKLNDEQTSRLRAVLLSEKTYVWDVAKACEPLYGVRVEFQHESQSVDVLFCFECDILTVYENEKVADGEDFDPARDAFVTIFKEVFPEDDVVQSLK